MEILFWILFAGVFYTYLGYAIIIFIATRFMPKLKKTPILSNSELPGMCLFVAAFNEMEVIEEKVKNTLDLDYPPEKLQILFVTDGSTDGTPQYLKSFTEVEVQHSSIRAGKIAAMNRGIEFVKMPLVVFTDANTILNKGALRIIASEFKDEKVGCVAGQKSILNKGAHNAAGSGEGLYWRFESWLKLLDARFHSAVGAVGEIFSVRTILFEKMETDTILDDFIISLRIAEKGFRLAYAPGAIACETASLNMEEEMKRKVRIAAGGIQTLFRMKELLNPFKYGRLSFQYISHKVSRWTIAPWCLFLALPANILIVLPTQMQSGFYWWLFILHLIFYVFVVLGWLLKSRKMKLKFIFIPFFFVTINLATIKGQIKYFRGKQSVIWDKSKRS